MTIIQHNIIFIFRLLQITRLVLAISSLILSPIIFSDVGLGGLGGLMSSIEISILLGYLSSPYLREKLKQYYLPIAIIWSSLMPMLVRQIWLDLTFNIPQIKDLLAFNPLFEVVIVFGVISLGLVIIIVPVVVIAWCYHHNVLIGFCIGMAILETFLLITLIPLSITSLVLSIFLIWNRTLLFLITGIIINGLVQTQNKQEAQLKIANHELKEYANTRAQLATSRERNRLARELHDTLAHTLATITVQLEAIGLIWHTQPQQAEKMLHQVTQMMRDGLTETRLALQALRSSPLENLGFANAVLALSESIMIRYPVTIHTTLPNEIIQLDIETEHTLYRIIQEALFNAVQHSHAQEITLDIRQLPTHISIRISDNGIGFDVTSDTIGGHFGILGMRERAESLHANFHIESKIGYGTTVMIDARINDNTHFDL